MRLSRKETFNLITCVFTSLSEAREKPDNEIRIRILEKLVHKLSTDEWDTEEESKKGNIITYLNDSNYETIYNLILKRFIAEASAQEIWEAIYYEFPNIDDYDVDDLTNEIVNLDFYKFMNKQGSRFKEYYDEYMKNANEEFDD